MNLIKIADISNSRLIGVINDAENNTLTQSIFMSIVLSSWILNPISVLSIYYIFRAEI